MKDLLLLDPVSAEKIHPNNHRRIVRALEIIEVTGKTKSIPEENAGHGALYDHLIVGLDMDRDVLYERIDRRSDRHDGKGLATRSGDNYGMLGFVICSLYKQLAIKSFIISFMGTLRLKNQLNSLKKIPATMRKDK